MCLGESEIKQAKVGRCGNGGKSVVVGAFGEGER